MVAKISTGSSLFGALAYNQDKVDRKEAEVLFYNKMLLSEDGRFSIGGCMRSFEMQMPIQLSTQKPILHISINPHPEDVLTDQQLADIAPPGGWRAVEESQFLLPREESGHKRGVIKADQVIDHIGGYLGGTINDLFLETTGIGAIDPRLGRS